MKPQMRMRWEGAFFNWHSLAHVNRELCLRLLPSGQVELSVLPTEPAQVDSPEAPRFAPLAERIDASDFRKLFVGAQKCWD
jgi:hypothetical protein